jgi:hypothetical protein
MIEKKFFHQQFLSIKIKVKREKLFKKNYGSRDKYTYRANLSGLRTHGKLLRLLLKNCYYYPIGV